MAQTNDEIDLLEVLAKVVHVARRNAMAIILALIAGILLGLTFYLAAQKVYSSKMILLSDILTSSYSERITESLDRLIVEGNTKVLSEKLKMSIEDAKLIAKIKIESVKAEKVANEKDNEIFIVTVTVLDNKILPELQENIITYLRNNEYIKIRVEQKKIYTEETIKKIDEELLALEQLKSKIEKGEFVLGNKENLVVFDPTTVHTKILDLTKERRVLQNTLQTINSIQLVEGFTVFEKPVSPKLVASLSYGVFLGLLLAVALIGAKIIRKMLDFSQEKLGQS